MAKKKQDKTKTAEEILAELTGSNADQDSDDVSKLDDLMSQLAGDEEWLEDELDGDEYSGMSHGLRHLKCLQKNSETLLKGEDWWGLVPTARDDVRETIFFQDPLISPVIDRCTDWNSAIGRTVGARQAWSWNADGSNNYGSEQKPMPVCKSMNGRNPLSMFYGKDMKTPDPNTRQPVRIGFTLEGINKEGQPVWTPDPVDQICEHCALNQYGEGVKTICKSSWIWVVYLPPQVAYRYVKPDKPTDPNIEEVQFAGETVVLQGSSSVQKALMGASQGEMGAQKNGNEIRGIGVFSKAAGTESMVVPVDKVVKDGVIINIRLAANVRAFAVGGSKPDVEETTYLPKYDTRKKSGRDDLNQAIIKAAAAGAQWFTLEVPTFPYAPQGRFKDTMDKDRPMFFLRMKKVESNFRNNPFVPLISVSEEVMSEEDLAAYITAELTYRQEEMRDKIMRKDDDESLKAKVEQAQPYGISAPDTAGQLPAGDVPLSDMDVTEAEYVDNAAEEDESQLF